MTPPECGVCKSLNITASTIEATAVALIESASKGCPTCSLLLEGIRIYAPDWESDVLPKKFGDYSFDYAASENESGVPGNSWLGYGGAAATFSIRRMAPGYTDLEVVLWKEGEVGTLKFFTLDGQISPWGRVGRRISPYDCSMANCLKMVPSWIKECSKHHPLCAPPEEATLPTRVIYVGNSRDDQELRLVIPHNMKAQYICLSHCWGQTQHLTTTTMNLSERLGRIPWESIPKTFQDAIEFTRRLKIKYLWIDSLCIVQDDILDWEAESAAMASIYGHSFLTIAATAAQNSNEGLFAEQNPRMPRSYALKSGYLCTPKCQVFAHRHCEIDFLKDMDGMNSAELYPLHQRGWTLQEHLLSPRMLHFGPDEIIWECSQTLSCCCDEADSDHGLKHFFGEGFGGQLTNSYVGRELEACWQIIVTLYSSRQLTVESDKLPAISGLAQKWQPSPFHTYLAGFWKNDLLYSLTWYSGDPSACHRPREYRAPSWSWAAIDGPIRFTPHLRPVREEAQADIEILEAEVSLQTSNSMGAVTAGHLKLLGRVVETTYVYDSSPDKGAFSSHRTYSCNRNGLNGMLVPDVAVQLPGFDHLEQGTTVYCLEITNPLDLFGIQKLLALRPFASKPRIYKRIGVFRISPQVIHAWFNGDVPRTEITIL